MKSLHVSLWVHTSEEPMGHGFTPSTPETMEVLRLGPLCIAAEVLDS